MCFSLSSIAELPRGYVIHIHKADCESLFFALPAFFLPSPPSISLSSLSLSPHFSLSDSLPSHGGPWILRLGSSSRSDSNSPPLSDFWLVLSVIRAVLLLLRLYYRLFSSIWCGYLIGWEEWGVLFVFAWSRAF